MILLDSTALILDGAVWTAEQPNDDVVIKIQKTDKGMREADFLKVEVSKCGHYEGSRPEFITGKEANIIHLDLKPENVLLKSADLKSGVQIADFGESIRVSPQDSTQKLLEDFCTTFRFMPPEVLEREISLASFATDVWSLGIILFEITYRKNLLKNSDRDSLWKELQEKPRLNGSIDVKKIHPTLKLSSSHQKMLQRCLTSEYNNRIKFEEMKQLLNSTWGRIEEDDNTDFLPPSPSF
ncbi:unnamed protein product, partial [Mesorhabditis belari]|uniref:Protein kinase domain-containing protein n=1 Tax=Mesorhabditis belari TaxID=2138241 RepID=A0AAF3EXU9_9BILA